MVMLIVEYRRNMSMNVNWKFIFSVLQFYTNLYELEKTNITEGKGVVNS